MNNDEKVSHSNYRPEIDGLRAVSVLAVILFHSNLFMNGGYVGVDIFFVISGYLITSIIFAEIEQERFSLIVFWERRVRRIFPAVALMQIVVIGLGILLYYPQDLDSLFKSSIYLSCNLPNVNYWRSLGYFSESTIVKPLLHTWSLGVEEQFYIVYPIAIAILYRYLRRRSIVIVLFSLGVISFCSNIHQSYFGDTATAFYLLPARTWELMSGCLLVFVNPFRNRSKLISESLANIGIASMTLSMILIHDKLTFPGFWAVPSVLGACLFIGSNAGERTFAGNILSAGMLVLIGKISFSLYLWHWPLIVFPGLYFPDHRSLRLGFVALSFPLAFVSWKFVEEPIRRKRILSTRKSIFRFYVLTSCILIALALFGVITRGMSFRTKLLPERAREYLALGDSKLDASKSPMTTQEFIMGKREYLGDRSDEPPGFLVWGDSHAISLSGSFDRVCRRMNVSGCILARFGTPPKFLNFQADPIVRSIQFLDPISPVDEVRSVLSIMNSNGIEHLILVFRWDLMPDSRKISAFLDLIGEISPDTKVFVVDQFPKQNYGPRMLGYQAMLAAAIGEPFRYRTTNKEDYSQLRAHVIQAMNDTSNPNAIHIPVAGDCFDANGQSRYKEGNRVFYYDDDHLSVFGAERLFDPIAERMLDTITRISD